MKLDGTFCADELLDEVSMLLNGRWWYPAQLLDADGSVKCDVGVWIDFQKELDQAISEHRQVLVSKLLELVQGPGWTPIQKQLYRLLPPPLPAPPVGVTSLREYAAAKRY